MTHTAAQGHVNGLGEPVAPIPVHVSNAGELAGMGHRDKPRRRIRSVFRTFVLTAANPIACIMAENLSRYAVLVVAYGNSVVLCESQSQAQDPANQVAGTGVFANTPANPQGALLYVPSGASFTTLPSPISAWQRLEGNDAVWATALAYPSMVAVILQDRAEGY